MGQLKANGYELTSDSAEADTIVVNTCGFIDSAKKESIDTILDAARLKADGQGHPARRRRLSGRALSR